MIDLNYGCHVHQNSADRFREKRKWAFVLILFLFSHRSIYAFWNEILIYSVLNGNGMCVCVLLPFFPHFIHFLLTVSDFVSFSSEIFFLSAHIAHALVLCFLCVRGENSNEISAHLVDKALWTKKNFLLRDFPKSIKWYHMTCRQEMKSHAHQSEQIKMFSKCIPL